MVIKTTSTKLVIQTGLLFILLCCCHANKTFEVSVPIDAYEIRNISNFRFIRSVEFKVKVPHLSREILFSYDKRLKEKGWIPFIEEYYTEGDRTWISSSSENRLIAFWIDKQKTKRITLEIQQEVPKVMHSWEMAIEQIVVYEERPYFEQPYSPDYYYQKKK